MVLFLQIPMAITLMSFMRKVLNYIIITHEIVSTMPKQFFLVYVLLMQPEVVNSQQ